VSASGDTEISSSISLPKEARESSDMVPLMMLTSEKVYEPGEGVVVPNYQNERIDKHDDIQT
jgi:hypothetical protein